jgi:hypothetical protein
VRPEGDEGEETEQRRGGAHDRKIGPLTLGFDAKMRAVSWKVTSSCQRETNHWRISTGAASTSVQRKACGCSSPRGSRASSHRMGSGGRPEWYQTAMIWIGL